MEPFFGFFSTNPIDPDPLALPPVRLAPTPNPASYLPEPARPKLDLSPIATPVLKRGNHDDLKLGEFLDSPIGKKLAAKVAKREKLTFLLPAFPAKSSSRDKTVGPAPDMGEFIGLQSLNAMCQEIAEVYGPGAEVVICSDGRVFNDLVMVSDEDLDLYSQRIREIIETEGLSYLSTYSLDDCTDRLDAARLREDFVDQFGPDIQDIRDAAKADPHKRAMFNGIHRFLKEDLGYHHPDMSRNQVMKRSKSIAYEVVQRSQSWDNLLENVFPDALRLSIHPYPISHRKFGVKLVSTSDRWATPWHNVTVKEGESYRLMKRQDALALGAMLKFHNGSYAYYEA